MASILKNTDGVYDYVPNVNDPIRTQVLISLFSDAAAQPGDPVPAGAPRRGWWGFSYDSPYPYPRGSRLWLLQGSKATDDTLAQAQAYGVEALKWMLNAGLISGLRVTAERYSDTILALGVYLTLPDGSHWSGVWDLTLAGPVAAPTAPVDLPVTLDFSDPDRSHWIGTLI